MRDERPTHLDLFSGIGGFALAARWAGFRTVGFCEIDGRCQSFLEATWGLPYHDDIKTFDAKPYRGVSLLTGGPPCQPASRAGKQHGTNDDRWLWGEALRVLKEIRPAWVVYENPPGIEDVGFDGILAEMEDLGYAVRPFDIPACAVGSPQLRHRYWIVGRNMADTSRNGQERIQSETRPDGQRARQFTKSFHGSMADRKGESSGPGFRQKEAKFDRAFVGDGAGWNNAVWVPCDDGKWRRAPDCSYGVANGLHSSILVALGNCVVAEVAFQILKAIREQIAD